MDALRTAPPGLVVCRPSLPRPARPAALRLPRWRRRRQPQARASPGSRASGSGGAVTRLLTALGTPCLPEHGCWRVTPTAVDSASSAPLLAGKSCCRVGRSIPSSPSPRGDARTGDHGGRVGDARGAEAALNRPSADTGAAWVFWSCV